MAVDSLARPHLDAARPAVIRSALALRVLDLGAPPLPQSARTVPAPARPSWMPRLLPVFAAGAPLHVRVPGARRQAFSARLLTGLAAIFAAAGAGARLRVVAWEDGFAVGGHRLERLGPSPHAFLVAAPLEAGSLAAAARAAAGLPPDRTWLVLDGDLPRLDPVLGIGEVAARLPPGRVVRLPLLGRREMEALARRAEPCMARRSSGMRHLELARALAHAYLEQQR